MTAKKIARFLHYVTQAQAHILRDRVLILLVFVIIIISGAIKTYFKTLKAGWKKALTRRSIEGLPEVNNKLEESDIMARRSQRLHNVSW